MSALTQTTKSWSEKSRPGQFVWYSRTARRGGTRCRGIVNNNKLKSQMTKLLIPILILKIVVALVVGIVCGALILRFIFEVGATQTFTNSRNQQWG